MNLPVSPCVCLCSQCYQFSPIWPRHLIERREQTLVGRNSATELSWGGREDIRDTEGKYLMTREQKIKSRVTEIGSRETCQREYLLENWIILGTFHVETFLFLPFPVPAVAPAPWQPLSASGSNLKILSFFLPPRSLFFKNKKNNHSKINEQSQAKRNMGTGPIQFLHGTHLWRLHHSRLKRRLSTSQSSGESSLSTSDHWIFSLLKD